MVSLHVDYGLEAGRRMILDRIVGDLGRDNQDNRVAWTSRVLAELPAGSRLLDAGAGIQRYRPFCKHLRYVSQDFAAYDPKQDAEGLHTATFDYQGLDIVSDICAIPEPDGSFDAILCTEVLEHIPDPVKAVVEFSRLLRPGGKLILTLPFCSLTHMAPYHFSTGFTRYWVEHHLLGNGFANLVIDCNGDWFSYIAQELRRSPSMVRDFGKRRPSLMFRACMGLALWALGRASRGGRASGSETLLCYGLHVVATKSAPPQPSVA
jgi:SAM-dependent methyltransferase